MSKRSAKESDKQATEKKKQKTSLSPSKDEAGPKLARYFVCGESKIKGSQSLKYCPEEKAPTEQDNIKKFVEKNGLDAGDVVKFGNDNRDVETYIVVKRKDDDALGLIKNVDDSGSGYLTIPADALTDVPNFFNKYKSVIEALPAINFRLVVGDDYLKGYLGSVPTEGWEFSVSYTLGKLENFSAKPSGDDNDFQKFNLEKTTWDDIKEFFALRSGDLKKVKVNVKLEDDKFEEYKSRFSSSNKAKEWMGAQPELPKGWTCERGKSSGGATNFSWDWNFSGPEASLEAMKANIDSFLEDFSHQYI